MIFSAARASIAPRTVGAHLSGIGRFLLRWLAASLQVAAALALLALVHDAFGSPLFAHDPVTRLRWVALLGSGYGLLRLSYERVYRDREEGTPDAPAT